MANQNTTNIVPPTVIVPSGYSNSPLVGKIQQLYDANNNNLYKKLSPYTENSGLFSFGPRQPYVYVNPNQGRKGINGLKRFESRAFPFASTLQDTIRVSKFLIGGNGILFLTKQFLLQKSQAFNETRIYNPLSPILAASTKINPFSDKNPLRHIDTSGGLLGALASIVGVSALNKPTPPKGTVGPQALSTLNQNNSKGLIRAGTAISAYNSLSIKNPKSSKGGFLASLPIVSFAKSLFGGFGPLKHPGNAKYRADEGAYGIFLTQPQKFSYFDKNGKPITWGTDFYQRFEAGKNTGKAKENIKKFGQTSTSDSDKKIKIFGQSIPMKSQYFGSPLGYDIKDDTHGYKKYGSNVGKERSDLEPGAGPYQFSDILSIYTTLEGKPAFRSYRLPSDTAEKPNTQIPRDISDENKGKSWGYRQEANNKIKFIINSGNAAYNIKGTYSNKIKEDPNSGVRTLQGAMAGRSGNKIEFLPDSAFDATGKVISVRAESVLNEHKNKKNESAHNIEGTYSNEYKISGSSETGNPPFGVLKHHSAVMETGISGSVDATGKPISVRVESVLNEHKNKKNESAYNIKGTYSNKIKEDPNSGVRTLHGAGMGTGLSGRNENKEFLPDSAFDATGKVISVRGSPEVNEHKKNIINSLNDALKKINTDYNTTSYESRVDVTYNKLVNHRYPQSPLSGSYEKSINDKNPNPQKGLSTTGKSDTINSLSIMVKNFPGVDDSSIIYNKPGKLSESMITLQKYNPYEDDFIAFYFHDLVNETYIPFRATVKGIQENANANWADINYIGRADKLCNYTGFTRTLGFNFKAVAMSIQELLPMWKRINYLVGLTKPAKYTDYTYIKEKIPSVSNFIVPPLITITIGDLYKEQPVILKSVTISIPEDVIWEITPELNNESNTWKYLNNQIEWNNSGGKYAQFPTECEIQISTDILETERPRTGGRNFGGGESGGGFSKQLIVA